MTARTRDLRKICRGIPGSMFLDWDRRRTHLRDSHVEYPLMRNPGRPWRPASQHFLIFLFESVSSLLIRPGSAPHVDLQPLAGNGPVQPLRDDDMPLIFLVHNDERFLPSFYDHYRGMGVTRFICVDDASTDGTRDFLSAQPDTDVWTSNVRYREAARGRIWRERLLARYGANRWYLMVDSDEYFVYESFGRENILDYTRRLDRERIRRVAAPMLDLYPVGRLGDAEFKPGDTRMPWVVASHFDRDGYTAKVSGSAISVRGGVRARVFDAHGELIKYPLMRWDHVCSLGRTIHRPRPAFYNFAPVTAALLHFKIFSDLPQTAAAAIREGQHYKDARIYRNVAEKLEGAADLDLSYAGSIPYAGVDDLIERGFVVPIASY